MHPGWFVFWLLSPLIGLALTLLGGPFIALGGTCIVAACIVVYFLPAIVAARLKHNNLFGVSVLNVFLGWTLVGWVVAVVWAFAKPQVVMATSATQGTPQLAPLKFRAAELRTCPFCAEEIRASAVKCKHCGSTVAPTV